MTKFFVTLKVSIYLNIKIVYFLIMDYRKELDELYRSTGYIKPSRMRQIYQQAKKNQFRFDEVDTPRKFREAKAAYLMESNRGRSRENCDYAMGLIGRYLELLKNPPEGEEIKVSDYEAAERRIIRTLKRAIDTGRNEMTLKREAARMIHSAENEKSKLVKATSTDFIFPVITIVGVLGGLFFLSSNLTGNAIGNITGQTSTFIGIALLVAALIAGFFLIRKK